MRITEITENGCSREIEYQVQSRLGSLLSPDFEGQEYLYQRRDPVGTSPFSQDKPITPRRGLPDRSAISLKTPNRQLSRRRPFTSPSQRDFIPQRAGQEACLSEYKRNRPSLQDSVPQDRLPRGRCQSPVDNLSRPMVNVMKPGNPGSRLP